MYTIPRINRLFARRTGAPPPRAADGRSARPRAREPGASAESARARTHANQPPTPRGSGPPARRARLRHRDTSAKRQSPTETVHTPNFRARNATRFFSNFRSIPRAFRTNFRSRFTPRETFPASSYFRSFVRSFVLPFHRGRPPSFVGERPGQASLSDPSKCTCFLYVRANILRQGGCPPVVRLFSETYLSTESPVAISVTFETDNLVLRRLV